MSKLKNTDGSHFRVNETVPFEKDWFFYLNSSPLPWYYRIIPLVADFGDNVDSDRLSQLLLALSTNFAYVHIDKYLTKCRLSFMIVTNKSLYSIIEIFDSIHICKLIY